MTSTLTRLALVLGLGLTPLAAQVQPPPKPTRTERLAQQLGLTDAQKTQVQALRQKHQESSTPKLQAAAEARKAFQEALKNPETPASTLKALHLARADREFDLLLDRRAFQSELRALLTPEQRAQWDQRQAHHRARMAYDEGGRRGHGRKR